MLQQPELLAPAGSLETLKYAVMYGADAVYCALPEFGMRAAPVNLTVGELHEGCIFAHARGKKVYLTLNTLPTNEELNKLPQYIQNAAVPCGAALPSPPCPMPCISTIITILRIRIVSKPLCRFCSSIPHFPPFA